LIKSLKEKLSASDVSTNESPEESVPAAPDEPEGLKSDEYASIVRDGVEVVDVKVIPIEKDRVKLDKFGIPIPKSRKTWDKI